jgi:hypothetical protein
MTKIRAEQIKSELELGTLAGDIEALTEQIGSIIGAEWKETESTFANVQLLDLADHLNADHATDLQVLQNLVASGSVKINGDAAAAVGALYLVGASKEIAETESVIFAGGKLSVVGIVSGSGALQGASVAVDGAATVGNGLTVSGAVADFNAGITANEIKIDSDVAQRLYIVDADGSMKDESKLVFDGSKLAVTGIVSGSAALQGASVAVDGAATIGNGLTVSGAVADFNAGVTANEIKIDGDTATRLYIVDADGSMKDEANLTYASSKLSVVGVVSGSGALQGASVAVDGAATIGGNASVGGNLTVTGDFTVNGTQTVVNTETVTIADHNIVIDSNNGLGAVVDGAGFTFEGGTGSDLTFQWNATHSDMELKLGGAFAKMHIGDLAAVSGAFTGDLDVDQLLTAKTVKIDGDTATRLYMVGADGEIMDSADLTYASSKLSVAGVVSGSAALQGASVAVDGAASVGGAATVGGTLGVTGIATFSAAITGSAGLAITGGISGSAGLRIHGQASVGELKIDGDTQQRLYVVDAAGKLKDEAGLTYNFVDLLTVSGSIKPAVNGAFKLGLTTERFTEIWGAQANLNGVNGLQLDRSGDQQIRKATAGDLIMSSSVAAGFIKFDDAYRGSQLLNSATAGLKLANSGEWATFAAAYPSVDSILGAFNTIAAGGGAEKGFFVAASAVAAETAVDVSAGAGMADMSFAGLTKDNSMVFFNGQLLRSGSVANLASPASADYSFDGGAAAAKFAFAVEIGDQLVVQKL